MQLFFIFAAGVVIGRSWKTVKDFVVPFAGDAAERFDAVYADVARGIAQRVEDVEDRVAEQKYRAGRNGSAHAGSR